MIKYVVKLIYWIVVIGVLVSIFCKTGGSIFSLSQMVQPPLWLRLPGLGALALAMIWAFSSGLKLFEARALKSWWDPSSKPDGDLSWNEVLKLTLSERKFDPVAVKPKPRLLIIWYIAMVALTTAMIGCAASPILRLLVDPDAMATLVALLGPSGTGFPNSGSLTAFLAFSGAVLTIIFTFQQLRAKVRAENRQAWIAKLRTLISEVTALAYEYFSASRLRRIELWQELGPKSFEFELMLNPRERDHRLLMYLVQRLTTTQRQTEEFIDDAKNLREIIFSADLSRRADWERILNLSNRNRDDREKLIGYIVRLSHVVLKREWERVKRAR